RGAARRAALWWSSGVVRSAAESRSTWLPMVTAAPGHGVTRGGVRGRRHAAGPDRGRRGPAARSLSGTAGGGPADRCCQCWRPARTRVTTSVVTPTSSSAPAAARYGRLVDPVVARFPPSPGAAPEPAATAVTVYVSDSGVPS